MDTWVNQLHARASVIHGQISAWMSAMQSVDADGISEETKRLALQPLYELLGKLYAEDLPIAQVRDNSDLIVHAEGPAAIGSSMQLRAVNWISAQVKRQLQLLAQAALPNNKDADKIAKKMQWNVTGIAPGSIFMGFALVRPPTKNGFEESDNHCFDAIVKAAQALPIIPRFIQGDHVSQGLTEVLVDPAVRDAAMYAAMRLSPTDTSGLASVEISTSHGDFGTLGQHERIVLRESLRSPLMRQTFHGSFVGDVREIDLDAGRIELRNVSSVGTIRCAFSSSSDTGKQWLDRKVRVTGTYESDRSGKPRLMMIESIVPIENGRLDLS